MKKQRRLLLCIMALAIVAGNVAGCSAGDTPETRATAPPGTEAAADTTGAADVPETKDHSYTEPEATYENGSAYEPFGTPFSFEVPSDDGTVTFSVQVPDNYPVYISVNGDGHDFYELKDGTEVMLGYLDGAKAGSLEEVFTALKETLEGQMANGLVSDNTLEIEESYEITLDDQPMFKIRGVMDREDETVADMAVLGYTTKLSNGAYAYWVIGRGVSTRYVELRRAAENMAMTFREVAQ